MNKKRLSTLMYHDIVEKDDTNLSGFKGSAAEVYKLTPQRFNEQLDLIFSKTNEKPVTIENIPETGSWLLSFDDGGESSYTSVADILENRGWFGHFFISTDYIDSKGFLSRQQIKDLRKRGHTIGSHSCSHPQMNKSDFSEILKEWQSSIEVLSDILGEKVNCASVPGGQCNKMVIEAAQQAGINYLFTSTPTTVPQFINKCMIIGRFGIKNTTSSVMVANLASGAQIYWLYQRFYWELKQLAKKIPH